MPQNQSISLVIPVYNGGYAFVCCLLALKKAERNWELIVVDDGSTDRSAAIAARFGAKILTTNGRQGPGFARNLGATAATGDYLCFIDADCEVGDNTLVRLEEFLQSHPDIDALFGSYDDTPQASNFVAQYKNLFHHYVHQNGSEEASTFWAGFGVVKRSLFLKIGGFNTERYPRPSIEDIDLGYRIRKAGGKIYLAKNLQVKHHKAWHLLDLIKTDIFARGIPWTRLLLSDKSNINNDLNLQNNSRISLILVYCLLLCLLGIIWQTSFIVMALILAGLLLWLNWDVYRFYYQKRGFLFALGAIFMHWLYYFYGGLAFLLGSLLHIIDRKLSYQTKV